MSPGGPDGPGGPGRATASFDADDRQLIERAQRGDLDAFGSLVERYQALARRTAWYVAGPHEADDAVQEAFVKAHRAIGRFRLDAPFRPWILRIVANEARNRLRGAGRRQAMHLRLADAHEVGNTTVASPEALSIEADGRRELLDAVQALPENDRLVIVCRYFLELSEKETAETLQWPVGSVKSRTSRALDRLKGALG